MAKIPEEITVKVRLSQDSLDAIADIVAYGTVGTILEAALDILAEVDYELSLKLDALAQECLARFHDAENILTPELGI